MSSNEAVSVFIPRIIIMPDTLQLGYSGLKENHIHPL
jgi:hypothetical protein